jgi:hypothetical protein
MDGTLVLRGSGGRLLNLQDALDPLARSHHRRRQEAGKAAGDGQLHRRQFLA